MKDQGCSEWRRTDGRHKSSQNKRRYQLDREPAAATVDEPRFQIIDSCGNNEKLRAFPTNVTQVADGTDMMWAGIEDVVDNPSSASYARRNIITKGSIIDASASRARVTPHPGQGEQVNAVVVDDK